MCWGDPEPQMRIRGILKFLKFLEIERTPAVYVAVSAAVGESENRGAK